MKAALFLTAILISLGLPGRAVAADSATEEARQHFLKGQQLFDVGRWDDAAAEFEQAYAARSDPTFIYNMAQAYRRKGDTQRALDLYKNYLIKAPKTPQRAEVEERIASLQKQIEEERAGRNATPAAPPSAPAAAATPVPVPAASAPDPVPESPSVPAATVPSYTPMPAPAPVPAPAYVQSAPAPPPPPTSSGKGLRAAGIVCGATGVVALGLGIFFGLEADDYASTVEKRAVFQPDFDDRGKLYQTLQWVGYGAGVALIGTGAVLYGLGLSAARKSAVAVAPSALPGGAGLVAQGVF